MTDTREPETVDGEVVEEIEDEQHHETTALDAVARAEIDVQIATARRFPRNLTTFKNRLRAMATLDVETAEQCFFSLPRGNKIVQGPGVRLSEMAASSYGNIRYGARILGESEDGKRIRAMGYCHDLETNVAVEVEAQRRITNKRGRKYNDDMVATTAQAAVSIALRNAIFRIVPRALVKPAYERAKVVATGDAKTHGQRRVEVLERLATLNPAITEERILSTLGHQSVEDLTVDDLTHLIGLGTAIRDGEIGIDEAFPEPERSAVSAEEIVGKGKKEEDEKEAKEKPEPEGEGAGEPAAAEGTGEEEKEEPEPYTELSPSAWSRLERQAEEAGITRQEWAAILARHTPDPHTVPPASAETDLLRVIDERGRKR